MTATALQVTYQDVEIAYDEYENVWRFTLRGRERKADSLAKAKVAIDKPVKEAKPFERVKAIKKTGWGDNKFKFGEVTSIAEDGYRGLEVWFISVDGEREKVSVGELGEDSAENRQLIAEIKALTKEAELLAKKAEAKTAAMTPLKITVPE